MLIQTLKSLEIAGSVDTPHRSKVGEVVGEAPASLIEIVRPTLQQAGPPAVLVKDVHVYAHRHQVLLGLVPQDAPPPGDAHALDGLGAGGPPRPDPDVGDVAAAEDEPLPSHLGELEGAVHQDAEAEEVVLGEQLLVDVGGDLHDGEEAALGAGAVQGEEVVNAVSAAR